MESSVGWTNSGTVLISRKGEDLGAGQAAIGIMARMRLLPEGEGLIQATFG